MNFGGTFPSTRLRRNRYDDWNRRLVAENALAPADLIWPIFLTRGDGQRIPVASMPGVDRVSVDLVAEHVAEAVSLANDSPYGLGAAIQSGDVREAARMANLLEVGMVTVNEASGTAAELPFGGVKRSGIGRELGKYGMEEFVNKKLIRVAATPEATNVPVG